MGGTADNTHHSFITCLGGESGHVFPWHAESAIPERCSGAEDARGKHFS